MSQLNEAIARYHKILESEAYRDLSWVKVLQDRMEQEHLSSGGRLLCPFLRPNFVTQRQYDALVKAGESLVSANYRMQQAVLASPALLAKLEMLPAEKMLAAIDPGYKTPEVSSKLDLQIHNGSLQLTQYSGDAPFGIAYGENLADIFLDSAPLKEFRRKYNVTRMAGKRPFLAALLEAYKQFLDSRKVKGQNGNGNGKSHRVKPNIALIEFRQTSGKTEFTLFKQYFEREGYNTIVISPEQLTYRDGRLKSGDFAIDLVYRSFNLQEFLVRFDLTHPLVQAYRDRKVCVVNSFRSEMAHKRVLLALLTDEQYTGGFPAIERRAIRDHVPWTRVVAPGKTTHRDESISVIDYILANRESLILKPNDENSDQPVYDGATLDHPSWERAVRQAQRSPYVVQERVEPARGLFPMMSYGHLEFREMNVDVHPQAFLGKVSGCSSWLSASSSNGFSSSAGFAPTFIIDSKV